MGKEHALYLSKAGLSRTFDISRSTIYRMQEGIEEQIKLGRYNRYAILDGHINAAVFADYMKYRKQLEDKNAKKYVPRFGEAEIIDLIEKKGASRE